MLEGREVRLTAIPCTGPRFHFPTTERLNLHKTLVEIYIGVIGSGRLSVMDPCGGFGVKVWSRPRSMERAVQIGGEDVEAGNSGIIDFGSSMRSGFLVFKTWHQPC